MAGEFRPGVVGPVLREWVNDDGEKMIALDPHLLAAQEFRRAEGDENPDIRTVAAWLGEFLRGGPDNPKVWPLLNRAREVDALQRANGYADA